MKEGLVDWCFRACPGNKYTSVIHSNATWRPKSKTEVFTSAKCNSYSVHTVHRKCRRTESVPRHNDVVKCSHSLSSFPLETNLKKCLHFDWEDSILLIITKTNWLWARNIRDWIWFQWFFCGLASNQWSPSQKRWKEIQQKD